MTHTQEIDFAESFEYWEDGCCLCKEFKPLYSPEFQAQLNKVYGRENIYPWGYICANCGKPEEFYINDCWVCTEDRSYFYGPNGSQFCLEHKEKRE